MRNTAEAGKSLLGALNDDELARYGEIARDQADLELNRWWLQALLALGAVGAAMWAVHRLTADAAFLGAWRPVVLALGVALALGYWPYRRVKNWTLWNEHVRAVDAEQARRRNG